MLCFQASHHSCKMDSDEISMYDEYHLIQQFHAIALQLELQPLILTVFPFFLWERQGFQIS